MLCTAQSMHEQLKTQEANAAAAAAAAAAEKENAAAAAAGLASAEAQVVEDCENHGCKTIRGL